MHHAVDPQLQMSGSTMQGQQNLAVPGMDLNGQTSVWPPGMSGMMGAGMEMPDSDRWSNSSAAPIAPTTLNVEDWFHFFGINGENMNVAGVDQ